MKSGHFHYKSTQSISSSIPEEYVISGDNRKSFKSPTVDDMSIAEESYLG
jgi:hypothetical protein